MKLIDLHKKWVETGEIEDKKDAGGMGGLCNAVPNKYYETLQMFEPEYYATYWASYQSRSDDKSIYAYNQLRQTIVLFICAMNNEL